LNRLNVEGYYLTSESHIAVTLAGALASVLTKVRAEAAAGRLVAAGVVRRAVTKYRPRPERASRGKPATALVRAGLPAGGGAASA
jgi:hypothetical protein